MPTPEDEERAREAVPVAATPQAVGLHGAVAAFDPEQESWSEYVERLEHYFTANDIASDDKRRAILLTIVGASTYRLIRTLVSPSKVTDFTFQQIVEKAKEQFSPSLA